MDHNDSKQCIYVGNFLFLRLETREFYLYTYIHIPLPIVERCSTNDTYKVNKIKYVAKIHSHMVERWHELETHC